MAGNAAFVAGSPKAPSAIHERRTELAGAQQPFAMVLTCADSRISPEHVFDCSLGELFVCRVAGNILEPGTLGSFEFALSQFESVVLLVVLGHQRCGAVTETIALVENGKSAEGSIETIVEAIRPAVEDTKRGAMADEDYVDAVVSVNAGRVARAILEGSRIVGDAVAAKRLKVLAARYCLDSGRVLLLGGPS